jgi:hypothetical protein
MKAVQWQDLRYEINRGFIKSFFLFLDFIINLVLWQETVERNILKESKTCPKPFDFQKMKRTPRVGVGKFNFLFKQKSSVL